MKRLLGFLLVVAVMAAAVVRPESADAHATLVRAEPSPNAFLQTAPTDLTLVFSEPIDARISSVSVLDAAGQPLALGDTELFSDGLSLRVQLPKLDPGIYNVLWTNLSRIDGHELRGAFPFTVLNPDGSLPEQSNTVGGFTTDSDPAPRSDEIAVRALSLLGLLLVAGPPLLLLLGVTSSPAVRRGLKSTVVLGGAVLVLATLLHLQLIHSVYSQPLSDLLLDTRTGAYWLSRFGAVMFILALTVFLGDAAKRASAGMLVGVAIYLWGYSATSHAAAGTGSAWASGIDLVHGVTAVAWIGAVIGVALTARLAWRNGEYSTLMPRFALLASVCVFFLLATGILSAFVEIDNLDRLVETRYGVTLLAKLALMLLLLAVALWNARWGKRRLMAKAPGEPRRFITTVTGEALLGIGVFFIAAMLTQTTAAKSIVVDPGARPFEETTAAGGLDLQLSIDPNKTGLNTYRVKLTQDGAPAEGIDRVRLTFRYQDDQTVGPSTLNLARASDGGFSGQGPFLTLEGRWRVQVEVRRESADDLNAFFDVRPAGSPVNQVFRGGSWDNPAASLSWNQFGGLVFVMAGLGFALFKGEFWRLGRRAGYGANAGTALGFGMGALLLFGVHSHEPTGPLPANPIAADQNSISTGRALYQPNCAVCHGPNGVPPAGLDMKPYPLDLTVHAPQHPDGQLFMFIKDGVPGTAMPAWGKGENALTDEQIWHLVNFLRTLGAVDR